MMQSADALPGTRRERPGPAFVMCVLYMILCCRPMTTTSCYPNLVTEWEITDDGLEYTFHLRDGVTFHDGTPWNADAVVFNIQRHIDNPDSFSHVAMSRVAEMEAH